MQYKTQPYRQIKENLIENQPLMILKSLVFSNKHVTHNYLRPINR